MVALRATGKKKPRLHGSLVSLAEYGTFGVEFLTLSDRTGNATYANSAEAVYRSVSAILPPPPPCPPHQLGLHIISVMLLVALPVLLAEPVEALVNSCLSARCHCLAAPMAGGLGGVQFTK